jgi:hypothetical protein
MDEHKVIATRMIDTNLEDYATFFDHGWAKEMSNHVHPRLADALERLCLAWKEAANTHRLPWLMIHQMEAFARGFMRRAKPDLVVLIGEFRDWLFREMNGKLQRVEKKAIHTAIKNIDQRLRLASQEKDASLPATKYCNDLLDQPEFQLSISGSQNLTYCGLVFGYEWFVVSCFRALGGPVKKRPSTQSFWAEFKSLLGGDPQAMYWDDPPIWLAREARNCIAHLGGKAKNEVIARNARPGLFISLEGVISVRTRDNRALFDLLKRKVTQLVGEVQPKLV